MRHRHWLGLGIAAACAVVAALAWRAPGGTAGPPDAPDAPPPKESEFVTPLPRRDPERRPADAPGDAPEPLLRQPVAEPVPDARGPSVQVLGREGDRRSPVGAARVLALSSTASWEAVAGPDGVASLAEAASHATSVWVRADGWGSARVPCVRIAPGPLVVELTRGGRVRLAWRTASGAEVPPLEVRRRYGEAGGDLTVRVVSEAAIATGQWCDASSPLRSSCDGWQADAAVEWSQSGVYLTERLSAGGWRVVVSRPGALPFVAQPVVLRDGGEPTVWIDLAPDAPRRHVKLVDALGGQVLAGAVVRPWFALVKDFAFVPGPPVTADSAGVVDLPATTSASGGTKTVWSVETATHAGEIDEAALAARPDEQTLTVRVFPAARIDGEAYVGPGVPATGAQVSWASRGGRSVRCVCGPDGRFALTGVALRKGPVEAVSLSVSTESATAFFAVQATAGTGVSVILGPKDREAHVGRVEGRVLAGGRALAGLQVVLAPLGEARSLLFTSTRPDGSFTFESVPEGTAKLRVTCGDPRVGDQFRVASNTPFRVGAGQTVQLPFDLPDAALRVTVVDAATGLPLEGVRVVAKPLDARDSATRFPGADFVPGWCAFTDAAGVALLPGVVAVAPHRIDATDGSRSARVEDAVAGTVAAPSEVRLALTK